MEILAPIPPKIVGPIEDRHLRRCRSYQEVKEEVEWEARNKTNVDLFRDTYKSTLVPAHCTASQVIGIFEALGTRFVKVELHRKIDVSTQLH